MERWPGGEWIFRNRVDLGLYLTCCDVNVILSLLRFLLGCVKLHHRVLACSQKGTSRNMLYELIWARKLNKMPITLAGVSWVVVDTHLNAPRLYHTCRFAAPDVHIHSGNLFILFTACARYYLQLWILKEEEPSHHIHLFNSNISTLPFQYKKLEGVNGVRCGKDGWSWNKLNCQQQNKNRKTFW